MSLHDRIMEMELVTETNDCDTGYNYGIRDAADLAQEADDLMAEMAAVLESASVGAVVINSAKDVLDKYDDWKESTK